MNKKVLITGSEGFIGKYLVRELEKRQIQYLRTDMVDMGETSNNYRKVSLLDKEGLRNIIREYQPDVVVHLAAIALVTHENIPEIYEVNVCGTENLLSILKDECAKNTRVILMSTAGVYGNQNVELYDETLPFNPANHYSYSKMLVEYMSRLYDADLDIKIVRPFNIIGTGQKETFLIPKLIKYFSEGAKNIPLGNISAVRDYISVDYCAYVVAELIEREQIDFKELNICSGIAHSGEDAIQVLEKYAGYQPKIDVNSSFVRNNEVWRMVGNPKRLLNFLDGNRGLSFEDILIKMMKDFQNNKY